MIPFDTSSCNFSNGKFKFSLKMWHEDSVSSALYPILFVCKVFGMCQIKFDSSRKNYVKVSIEIIHNYFYTGFLIIYALLEVYQILESSIDYQSFVKHIPIFIIKLSQYITIIVMLLYVSWICQSTLIMVITSIDEIDDKLRKLPKQKGYISIKIFLVCLFFVYLFRVMMWYLREYLLSGNILSWEINKVIISSSILSLTVVLFDTLILIVYSRLECLKLNLVYLSMMRKKTNYSTQLQNVYYIHWTYTQIIKVSENINYIFRYPLLFIILHNFFIILILLYYIALASLDILTESIALTTATAELLSILMVCRFLKSEERTIAEMIHTISFPKEGIRLREQVGVDTFLYHLPLHNSLSVSFTFCLFLSLSMFPPCRIFSGSIRNLPQKFIQIMCRLSS